MKSMMQNAVFNVIYKLIAILFPLITTAYVSRILMPSGVGVVSYAQNIASYFTAMASLGLPAYGVRELAKIRDDKQKQDTVYTELLVLNFVFTAISSLLYVCVVCFVDEFRNSITLYLACGLPVFLNFLNIDWFYQAREDYKYIAIRSIIIKTLSLICVVLFVKNRNDYLPYAFVLGVASVGNYIFNIIHAKKYVSISFKNISLLRHLDPIVSLGIVVILSAIYNKVDVTMLGIMSTDAVVGLYSNAHRGIDVVLTFCAAITATFFPRLSLYGKERKEDLNRLLNTGYKVITYISIPVMLGLLVLAQQLTELMFGTAFADAGNTFRIFSLLVIIRVYGDLFSYQLVIAIGDEKKRIITAVLAMVTNIIFNLMLIPRYMQNGAAIASVISELIMNGGLFIYVVRKLKLELDWIIPIKQAVISSIGMLVVVSLIKLSGQSLLFVCAESIVAGSIVYVLINILQKNEITIQILRKVLKRIK